ncbi:MAG: sugar-binding transcriptional regulator [Beutenbergiaceae bacterium]
MAERLTPERLAQAAVWYYVHDLSQDRVAKRLGTSRSNVSRMLRAAREQGIIRFEITYPTRRDLATEQVLQAELADYGVREVVVAADRTEDATGSEYSSVLGVGRAASEWLDANLSDGTTVGMFWGSTVRAMVDVAHFDRHHDVQVIQLAGEWSDIPKQSGHELVRDFAGKLGGRYSYFSAPAFTKTAAETDALLAQPSVAAALERARSTDMCIVGVGSFGFATTKVFLDQAGASAAEVQEATDAGVVGQLAGRFFDRHGSQVELALHRRLVSLDLPEVRQAETILVLCAGQEKAEAVLGAARGNLVDVLVCDQALARALRAALARA